MQSKVTQSRDTQGSVKQGRAKQVEAMQVNPLQSRAKQGKASKQCNAKQCQAMRSNANLPLAARNTSDWFRCWHIFELDPVLQLLNARRNTILSVVHANVS
jgi:hypothetical protein